jgi:hypothetical protein
MFKFEVVILTISGIVTLISTIAFVVSLVRNPPKKQIKAGKGDTKVLGG